MLTLQRVKARESEMKTRGVVKGNTIKLNKAPDLPDGQQVYVDVRAVPEYSGPDLYRVRARLAPGQPDFAEERRDEEFPATIYVKTPVVGAEVMRALRANLKQVESDSDAPERKPKYAIELALMANPPFMAQDNRGKIYFEDAVRVPSHIYGEDLMRIMMKAIGVDESETEIFAFRPFSKKVRSKGKRSPFPPGFDTNEIVNQIREEMGI